MIARLLCQCYQRAGGKITINSMDIDEINTQSLYSKIGYISQRTYLFNDTIRYKICLHKQLEDCQVNKAIEMAGLSEYVKSLSNGLNTVITKNGKISWYS